MAVKKEIKKVRQKRMKGEERRAQILEVATREFSRMGFEQTSMSDIADACGITKPVLYIHFKSKDELFTAAMEDRVDALSQSIQAAAPEPDPRERMLVMSTATMWPAPIGWSGLIVSPGGYGSGVHAATPLT